MEILYINETDQLNGPQITAQYYINQPAILVDDAKTQYATLGVRELQKCSEMTTDFCSIQSPIYQASMSKDCAYANFSKDSIKDARSVSFYPYNRSQVLQYVEYTK